MIPLPVPARTGALAVEAALAARRSCRAYLGEPLRLAEVGQLLWAAQGITTPGGKRTAPSAGALYPLEVYLMAGRVEGLATGVYRYLPREHGLELREEGDRRRELAAVALGQAMVAQGAVDLIITGVEARCAVRYGGRAGRYVLLEAGHASQNVSLAATALGLGTVVVGAFDDQRQRCLLGLDAGETPLVVMPVGRC